MYRNHSVCIFNKEKEKGKIKKQKKNNKNEDKWCQ
jgi:hypothetical protein